MVWASSARRRFARRLAGGLRFPGSAGACSARISTEERRGPVRAVWMTSDEFLMHRTGWGVLPSHKHPHSLWWSGKDPWGERGLPVGGFPLWVRRKVFESACLQPCHTDVRSPELLIGPLCSFGCSASESGDEAGSNTSYAQRQTNRF
eukprot:15436364-Alexandrium_andersonii.AAC.1